jgi:serine/threonine-protein kinase SRPK3
MMSRYLLSRVLPLRQVCRQPLLRRVHGLSQPTYHHSQLDNTENLEDYRPGGFHPTSIGDVFANGRYRVLHKLGWGGSSTVWLARDQQEKSNSGPLVALKVLSASGSSASAPEAASLHVSRELQAALASTAHPARSYIQNIDDDFLEVGPNGTHACLVSRFEGPSVLLMSDSPGRVSGSRRLRQDLARNVAMQSALALEAMHSVGFVHGGQSCERLCQSSCPLTAHRRLFVKHTLQGCGQTAQLVRH